MIRKIMPGDKEEYLSMAYDFYHSGAVLSPIPQENIENTFKELIYSDRYLDCYIFEDGGAIEGFALIAKTFSQEAGGIVIWIEELFIKPPFRNKGIAKTFFSFIEKEYSYAKRFRLETEPENKDAMKLYTSLGFKPFGYLQFKKGS